MIIRKYANKVVQDLSNPRCKDWNLLNNLLYPEGQVGQCNNISSSKGVKLIPAPITFTNFNFDLPRDAVINSIEVGYEDRKVSYTDESNDNTYPIFRGLDIRLVGTNLSFETSDSDVYKNFVKRSRYFMDLSTKLTVAEVNKNDFGVTLAYTPNVSPNVGAIYLDYVYIEIDYDVATYNVSMTEPNKKGRVETWSTPDEPHEVHMGEVFSSYCYIRTTNGLSPTEQLVVLYFPDNYKLDDYEVSAGRVEKINQNTYHWYVTPKIDKSTDYFHYKLMVVGEPFDNEEVGLIKATHDSQVAVYYVKVVDAYYNEYRNNAQIRCPVFSRNWSGEIAPAETFHIEYWIYDLDTYELESNDWVYPVLLKCYDPETDKYMKFPEYQFQENVGGLLGMKLVNQHLSADKKTLQLDIKINNPNEFTGKLNFVLLGEFMHISWNEGDYQFHTFFSNNNSSDHYTNSEKYVFNFRVGPEKGVDLEFAHKILTVNTPNIAVECDGGGFFFKCKTKEGFGKWNSSMSALKVFFEKRVKHIGPLKVPYSHHNPKFSFKNPVKKGTYQNRKYVSKTGIWEDELSLSIYLPPNHWKTLEGFTKMDRPVSIELCPSCSDDDVLNHRGWVDIQAISNIERVNSWVYKGEIDVEYLTRKYFGKASIILGARLCETNLPYDLINTINKGDSLINYFELFGSGQISHDLVNNRINEINCSTGEALHIRNKWALKDICDVTYYWDCILPSDPTDESNDYKQNSIVYTIIDNNSGKNVLEYTLYDFTCFDERGKVVNQCNANCVVYKNGRILNVFNKRIKLDWEEPFDGVFKSSTNFHFDRDYVTITESGANGLEIVEKDIELASGEYIIDVCFDNNDVGLIEPNFTAHLDVESYENILANPYSNFYNNLVVSPFPLPSKNLLFYRKSEEGILYYYTIDEDTSNIYYLVDGFQQYKGGVDLQTSGGSSVMFVENYNSTLYLSNNLIKVGFDRLFGTVSFYVYDASTNNYVYTNMVRLDDFNDFEIESYNDDKISVKFGQTLWTMWRGHPFIECQHENVDLMINDKYNTVECEGLLTPDNIIVYDGNRGKRAVYLYDVITTIELETRTSEGIVESQFNSGYEVMLVANVKDINGISQGFVDGKPIGRVEFIVNDESVYVDPTPSLSSDDEYEWIYNFVVEGNQNYVASARFIPELHFSESKSNNCYFNSIVTESITELTIPNLIVPINSSTDYMLVKVYQISNESLPTIINDMRVEIYANNKYIGELVTESDSTRYPLNFKKQGLYNIKAKSMGDLTYSSSESKEYTLCVIDPDLSGFGEDLLSIGENITLSDDVLIVESDDGSCELKVNKNYDFTGKLMLNIPNVGSFEMGSGESRIIKFPKSGDYDISVKYGGDDVYQAYNYLQKITVPSVNTNVSLLFDTYPTETSKYTCHVDRTVDLVASASHDDLPVTLYDNGTPVLSKTIGKNPKTLYYQAKTLGEHELQLKYNGTAFFSKSQSPIINLTVNNDITKIIDVKKKNYVYRYTQDIFKLVDSENIPLVGKKLSYKVNGVTYERVTNDQGLCYMNIRLLAGQYNVKITFEGDKNYIGCTKEYVLEVLDPITVWKSPIKIRNTHENNTKPFKPWSLSDTPKFPISCGDKSISGVTPIDGISGNYNTPDTLNMSSFNFSFSKDDYKIVKISARWQEKQFNPQSDKLYPTIGSASATLINCGINNGKKGYSIPLQSKEGYNIVGVEWTGLNMLSGVINNSFVFGVLFEHDKNTSQNPASLVLNKFELGVSYVIPTEIVEE